MATNKKKNSNLSGVLLLAKRAGLTSFSSLFSIKHALGTDKVGHTGTLDSFADGLLVVLAGSLTHLVPHITGFRKTYQALVCFGKETDTFDPTGKITSRAKACTKAQLEAVLSDFTGALLQVPPVYSAIHVDGQRASDLVRTGQEVHIEPRQIFVYSNRLIDFREASENDPCSYAILEIDCSKGTYIRALARDIAKSLGTCAHLCALRRTRVGPFNLEDSALYSTLPEFTIDNGLENERAMIELNQRILEDKAKGIKKTGAKNKDSEETVLDIQNHFMEFDSQLASKCGFEVDVLKKDAESNYMNGRPLFSSMFNRLPSETAKNSGYHFKDEIAVFYQDMSFAGMIKKGPQHLSYSFVVPKQKRHLCRLSWQEIIEGKFPLEFRRKGTALSVGSFDGFHTGHQAIAEKVLQKQHELGLAAGIVTFSSSVKSLSGSYKGDLLSLSQKLEILEEFGFSFAVVIDFSDDFSKIEAGSFIDVLVNKMNMKYLAEGEDFTCGYKGAFGMKELSELSVNSGFQLETVSDVIFEGERVSSSRIRKNVQKGRFLEASKMLSRPFSFDMGNAQRFSGDRKQGLYPYRVGSVQLLPDNGNYEAVAVLSAKDGKSTLQTSVNVERTQEGTVVTVLLPSDDAAERIVALNFIQ